MNAIEILINYSKLETVQNLVDNIDLVTDIIKDDVYKIAKSMILILHMVVQLK